VNRVDYDRIEAVNFSTLKLMAKSPNHYHHNLLKGQTDTNAMKVGRACHMAVFEPETFRSRVAKWEGAVRRGKEWDAFQAANKGLEILTEAEYDSCVAIGAAVRADATAKPYITGGKGEVTLRWMVKRNGYEMAAKGRVDFVANANGGCITDLKTTTDASPEAFGRQALRLLYHAQASFYVDGATQDLGREYPYFIVAVEKKEPYAVQVYEVPADALQMGRELYGRWLDQLNACRQESHWPAYSTGVLPLSLPAWATEEESDDGEGLTGSGF
jgi:PDDEXK-like domain of unknown function (DUF3799)